MTDFDLSKLHRNIAELSVRHEDILAVYLYGSWAEGRAAETSDLDLGIFLREGLSKELKKQQSLSLEEYKNDTSAQMI